MYLPKMWSPVEFRILRSDLYKVLKNCGDTTMKNEYPIVVHVVVLSLLSNGKLQLGQVFLSEVIGSHKLQGNSCFFVSIEQQKAIHS